MSQLWEHDLYCPFLLNLWISFVLTNGLYNPHERTDGRTNGWMTGHYTLLWNWLMSIAWMYFPCRSIDGSIQSNMINGFLSWDYYALIRLELLGLLLLVLFPFFPQKYFFFGKKNLLSIAVKNSGVFFLPHSPRKNI